MRDIPIVEVTVVMVVLATIVEVPVYVVRVSHPVVVGT